MVTPLREGTVLGHIRIEHGPCFFRPFPFCGRVDVADRPNACPSVGAPTIRARLGPSTNAKSGRQGCRSPQHGRLHRGPQRPVLEFRPVPVHRKICVAVQQLELARDVQPRVPAPFRLERFCSPSTSGCSPRPPVPPSAHWAYGTLSRPPILATSAPSRSSGHANAVSQWSPKCVLVDTHTRHNHGSGIARPRGLRMPQARAQCASMWCPLHWLPSATHSTSRLQKSS